MAVLSTEGTWFMGKEFKKTVRVLKKAVLIFKETLSSFKKSRTIERKVIIYSFQAPEGIVFAHGSACAIAAMVYIEKSYEIPGQDRKKYIYEEVCRDERLPVSIYSHSLLPRYGEKADDSVCLDWSQSRHDFFVRISDLMKTLKEALSKMESDQGLLLAMSDLNMNVLEHDEIVEENKCWNDVQGASFVEPTGGPEAPTKLIATEMLKAKEQDFIQGRCQEEDYDKLFKQYQIQLGKQRINQFDRP